MIPADRRRITLLDGATGTELERRGVALHPRLWSAMALRQAPEVLGQIHRAYLGAGVDLVTTCTFRTHARDLAAAGWTGQQDELNHLAVTLARDAIAEVATRVVRIAGSMAPLEDCFRVDRVPDDSTLGREHRLQATSLARAGVDLLLIETMGTLREALAAVAAARATGLPVWCSLLSDGRGRLLDGSDLGRAARTLDGASVDAILVNCCPAADIPGDVAVLAQHTRRPIGAYANDGYRAAGAGRTSVPESDPGRFAAQMMACVAAGASIVGGCCGTTPDHLSALAAALSRR